jgi:DNA-binding NtrC family response regulator
MDKDYVSGGLVRNGKEYENMEPVCITGSPIMTDLIRKIKLVAKTNATLLLTGENGTGKEVLARLVHYHSPRSNEPFVAVNCGAMPADLVESELFGHEKGAFTGAVDRKPGCFELANKGVLFLDEIGDMPHSAQVKLLRAVELNSFRRVGGKEETKVDVSLISATNKILIDQVKSGSFREDLFYRLNVIELNIPPLRHRKDDIPLLISYYIDFFKKKYKLEEIEFSQDCFGFFMSYDWPGNVRELRNIVERSYVLIGGGVIIEPGMLPANIQRVERTFPKMGYPNSDYQNKVIQIPVGMSFKEIERTVIDQTLDCVDDNKTEAAKILGFSRKTLHNKLDKYNKQKELAK